MVQIRFWAVVLTAGVLAPPVANAISIEDLLGTYGTMQTVAGRGYFREAAFNGWEESMEGGAAVDAELSRPHMTMADAAGNLYIADKDAHAIRLVRPDGTIHTIAGTSVAGFNGDGLGTDVELNAPNGLYTFPDGTTYILDLGNNRIRRLSSDGMLTTVVEDPLGIVAGRGLWVSPDEQLIYYSSGNLVRKWTASEGLSIMADGFVELGNLAVDPRDNQLVVTDRGGHGVYKVFPDGRTVLIAGNETPEGGGDGQPALSTGLDEVRGVYFHPEGGYFLATHHGGQIWFVDDNDTIHLLVDGDNDHTHAGDGLPLSSPGRKISEPRAVTLAPDGDLIITESDFGFVRVVESLLPTPQRGDFNRDGVLDATDIDLLTRAIASGTVDLKFDLDASRRIDAQDRVLWVRELKKTWFGDANLDGQFNSSDLVRVFQQGEFEDGLQRNSSWSTGDWNGDLEFDSGDFVLAFQDGGFERGLRTARAVPEPGAGWLSVWAALAVVPMISAMRRRSGRE